MNNSNGGLKPNILFNQLQGLWKSEGFIHILITIAVYEVYNSKNWNSLFCLIVYKKIDWYKSCSDFDLELYKMKSFFKFGKSVVP